MGVVEVPDFADGSVIRFLDGSERSVVTLGSTWLGRGTYRPGWRWSEHAGPMTGRPSEAHVGYVVSGRMVVETEEGEQSVMGPGDAWYSGPGHDAWVDGDEACVALDFPLP